MTDIPKTLADAQDRKARYMERVKGLDYRDEPQNGGYSTNEMHVVFTKVQDKENWKMPVNRDFHLTDEEVAILKYAVPHFTGGAVRISPKGVGEYNIRFVGYYNSIGA